MFMVMGSGVSWSWGDCIWTFIFFSENFWKNFWNQKYLWKLKKVEVAPLRSRPRNIQCYSLGYGHGVGWSCRENCNWTFYFFFWKLLKKFLKSKVFVKVEKSCSRSAPVTVRECSWLWARGWVGHGGIVFELLFFFLKTFEKISEIKSICESWKKLRSLRSGHGPPLILGYGFTVHAGDGSRGSVNFEEFWVASLRSWPRIGLIYPYSLSQKNAPRIF